MEPQHDAHVYLHVCPHSLAEMLEYVIGECLTNPAKGDIAFEAAENKTIFHLRTSDIDRECFGFLSDVSEIWIITRHES